MNKVLLILNVIKVEVELFPLRSFMIAPKLLSCKSKLNKVLIAVSLSSQYGTKLSCCSPGRGDNELRVFVGNQVTLVFWVLHCHLWAEDERGMKSIKEKVEILAK